MRKRRFVFGGVLVMAALAGGCAVLIAQKQSETESAGHRAEAPAVVVGAMTPLPYSKDEIDQFLASAKKAEAIEDRLQQCLSYPDPPGSHWDHAAVLAYCRYRLQPMMTASSVDSLLREGKFKKLEDGLGAALKAQQTSADSPGLLDQIYERAFSNTSDDRRVALDAWKKSSPASAFAYAASGYAYTQQAVGARGGEYEVSRASRNKMMRLLALAEADLSKAVALDPELTPAYVAWIRGSNLAWNRDYVMSIADRALSASPADYDIYVETLFALQPEWGGSYQEMRELANRAQAHAPDNPLLRVLLTNPGSVEIDHCGCENAQQVAAYQALFDQLPITAYMWKEGDLAATTSPGVSVVFLSETLRFLPANPLVQRAWAQRSFRLTDLGHPQWALSEAKRVVARDARDARGFNAEASAYEAMGDFSNAEIALRTATAIDPDDPWPLIELGQMYVVNTHQWEKGWEVVNQIVSRFPKEPGGWLLRGMVQAGQPRPGLADTVEQFKARFGNDPDQQARLRELRSMLQHQEKMH